MSKNGYLLMASVILLVSIGIVMIYSASAIFAYQHFDDSLAFLKRQGVGLVAGFILLFLTASIKPVVLERFSRWLVFLSILLLLCVYLPFLGQSASGARRWLGFFGFHFQPAEFSKIAMIIYFSAYLKKRIKEIKRGDLFVMFPPLLVLGIFSVLIVFQPDLGSVILLFFAAAVHFFIAGIRQRYIYAFGGACFVFFYFAVMKVPYRLERVTSYLDPWKDAQGSGFQIIQSFLAFGSGGVSGVGLGQSTQKLFYLPQSSTDFIYAIIAEETGFIGASIVILLFIFLFIQGVLIAFRQTDLFKRFVCFSLTSLIFFQAILNILVATGLIPTKGLPLPFISYGGSSLIINLMMIGIILSIDRDKGY